MEAPLTGSHLPREQCCHRGAAGAPPHLVPLEANRYIMRLLVLSSLCPPLHKSSITVDVLSLCSAALPVCTFTASFISLMPISNALRHLFTRSVKVDFACCSDVQNRDKARPSWWDSVDVTSLLLGWRGEDGANKLDQCHVTPLQLYIDLV